MAIITQSGLTQAGMDILSHVPAGGLCRITRVAAGDGVLAEGDTLEGMVNLTNERKDAEIVSITTGADNQTRVDIALTNTNNAQAFGAREVGVFAQGALDAEPVLFAVILAPDRPDWVAEGGETGTQEYRYNITIAFGDATKIEVVASSLREVVRQEVDAQMGDITAAVDASAASAEAASVEATTAATAATQAQTDAGKAATEATAAVAAAGIATDAAVQAGTEAAQAGVTASAAVTTAGEAKTAAATVQEALTSLSADKVQYANAAMPKVADVGAALGELIAGAGGGGAIPMRAGPKYVGLEAWLRTVKSPEGAYMTFSSVGPTQAVRWLPRELHCVGTPDVSDYLNAYIFALPYAKQAGAPDGPAGWLVWLTAEIKHRPEGGYFGAGKSQWTFCGRFYDFEINNGKRWVTVGSTGPAIHLTTTEAPAFVEDLVVQVRFLKGRCETEYTFRTPKYDGGSASDVFYLPLPYAVGGDGGNDHFSDRAVWGQMARYLVASGETGKPEYFEARQAQWNDRLPGNKTDALVLRAEGTTPTLANNAHRLAILDATYVWRGRITILGEQYARRQNGFKP